MFIVCKSNGPLPSCLFFFSSFQKGSPYIDQVNEKLQLLQQLGLIETWIKGAVSKASNCDTLSKVTNSHKRGEEASRNLYQIDGIFYILIFALLTSLAGKSKLL